MVQILKLPALEDWFTSMILLSLPSMLALDALCTREKIPLLSVDDFEINPANTVGIAALITLEILLSDSPVCRAVSWIRPAGR